MERACYVSSHLEHWLKLIFVSLIGCLLSNEKESNSYVIYVARKWTDCVINVEVKGR